ncbi:MAG: ABC transporter permease [Candidatus Binatia bacterium]
MTRREWFLITQLALKDFKIRYTHSLFGYAWSVVNPLIFTLIYYLVFSIFARFDIPNYPGYLLTGIVLWNFFAEGTANGVGSLMARAGILSKAPIGRHIAVCAAILNVLLTFMISVVILIGLLIVTGTTLHWSAVTFPILLFDLVLLTLGISLLLSPLHVRFHDIGYLWNLVVQIGFWLTPVIYHDTMLPPRWTFLSRFNPMARIIQTARQVLVYGDWPNWATLGRTTLISAAVMLVGTLAFRRLQVRVVEYF